MKIVRIALAGYFTQNTIIRALPTETVGAHRDQIPSRIFFDMRLGPVTPSVDVNVLPQD